MPTAAVSPEVEHAAAVLTAAVADAHLFDSCPWRLVVSTRRRTLGVTVEPGGLLLIHAPLYVGDQVERFIAALRGMLPRIIPLVMKSAAVAPLHPAKELVGGEDFPWLGRPTRLRVVELPGRVERITGGHGPWLHAPAADLRAHGGRPLIDWYKAEAITWATEEAERWYARLGLAGAEPTVRVRDIGRHKWGVYRGKSHTVDLHWSLFQLPANLVRYVLVHELVHATRPGEREHHGPEWTRRMTRAMPMWEEQRRDLVEPGRRVWMGDVVARPA